MGLGDRDYMRDRLSSPSILDRAKSFLSTGQGILTAATAVVALGSGAVWLYRDVRGVVSEFGPAQGSLIVNINTATQQQIETLPGIGPVLAVLIISGRPYATVDDLERVKGVGPGTVASLRPFIKVEGDTEKR